MFGLKCRWMDRSRTCHVQMFFMSWMLLCLLQVFAAISPMMIHQIKRDDFGHHDEKDEFIHLKIYKIWGEQIKTFHVDLCPDVIHDHVLKMFVGILNEVVLRTWCRRWCQTLSLDNTGHQATRKREHDQKGHKPGSSRPRRGVKTHLEECTTRYLGFKCFLFPCTEFIQK